MAHRVKVFLTVDTESSLNADISASRDHLDRLYARDIFGKTADGDFGIEFQLQLLNQYGLRGSFFVEPLFSTLMGRGPLERIVDLVQNTGHEVQLHIHTEWLRLKPFAAFPDRTGDDIADFTLTEQVELLRYAKQLTEAAGARDVCAFRAGNYGANVDTLRALGRIGIWADTSYNRCYLDSSCRMRLEEQIMQPRRIEGIIEFPVSCFADYPGHYRHAQLCATSASEMRAALLAAWENRWHSFVIVSHSFELLDRRRRFQDHEYNAVPDRTVIRRFKDLCQFLAKNTDKFETEQFSRLDAASIPDFTGPTPISTGLLHTGRRMVEQLARRL